jgi:hypothetical protein
VQELRASASFQFKCILETAVYSSSFLVRAKDRPTVVSRFIVKVACTAVC